MTMRLLSINVGLPREILIDGEAVQSGIFKTPVAGNIKVGKPNLAGDGQADLGVHGGPYKAVYAYPWENIVHWRTVLERPSLGPGSMGENLTTEGLLESDVTIGDEWEIGTARFQVTQPRLPCFKLAAALQLLDFPRRFLESLRTGFYLRVLQEGTIRAGDAINVCSSREPERVTIAELVGLHRTKQASLDQLRRIARLASLPPDQREWLARKFPAAWASVSQAAKGSDEQGTG